MSYAKPSRGWRAGVSKSPEDVPAAEIAVSEKDKVSQPDGKIDHKLKTLALGLEFSKRALDTESLEELFFILVNDIRALMEFDRAFLITHFAEKSRLVAASNQPLLEKKSKFYQKVNLLGAAVRDLDRGLLLSSGTDFISIPDEELSATARVELQSFMEFSGCAYLLCVPLIHGKARVGHLIIEFIEQNIPDQARIVTLLNMGPFFAAALAEKWLVDRQPRLASLIEHKPMTARRLKRFVLIWLPLLLSVSAVVGAGLFLVPLNYYVGGESEVVPRDKHVAFSKIDGIVDQIRVEEGSRVEKGQVLATLDRKDLDYEIKRAETQYEIYTKQMLLLRAEGTSQPAKLAESQLVKLKRKSTEEELDHLKWKTQFLQITAPVSGLVLTKDVESFAGKRFKAGEPFCEIAVPGDLWVVVYVPEDRITMVKRGQELNFYPNSDPSKGYVLSVEEVAPMAEVMPRLGNIYRVRAPFVGAPKTAKVGMKGVGKIRTMTTNLWFIISQRLRTRWNQLSIYL
jgi:hypothetical protein